jgi:hypothetical protein
VFRKGKGCGPVSVVADGHVKFMNHYVFENKFEKLGENVGIKLTITNQSRIFSVEKRINKGKKGSLI